MSQAELAGLIDQITCPECGQVATHMYFSNYGGHPVVAPVYSCSTVGCSYAYNSDERNSWTPALSG